MIFYKKILRDMSENKSQFIAVFIIIFLGVFIFSGLNAVWYGMQNSLNKYYNENNTANVWIQGSDIDEKIEKEAMKIDEIRDFQKEYCVRTSDIKDESSTVELTFLDNNKISKMKVVEGEEFTVQKSGIWLDYGYAKNKGYAVGDNFTYKLSGKELNVKIKGLVKNPEYTYYLSDMGQLIPDSHKSGYAYLSYSKNIDTPNLFNRLIIVTNNDSDSLQVKRKLNESGNFNNYYIQTRDDVASFRLTQDKINQMRSVAGIFPSIFFLITILIMSITMIRLIKKQKYEIGILQALGFKEKKISNHYLSYGIIVSLPASILGYVLGKVLLPNYIFQSFYMYDIPDLNGYLPFYYSGVILLMCIVSIFSVWLSLKFNFNKNIVSNLKGENNEKIKSYTFQKLKVWEKLPFKMKWMLIHGRQNILRVLTMIFSIACCMALMFSALNLKDSVDDIIPRYFNNIAKYENKLILEKNISNENKDRLISKYQAISLLENIIQIKMENQEFIENLTVYDSENTNIMSIKDGANKDLSLDDEGIFISFRLAKLKGINMGDEIQWKLPNDNKWVKSKIAGIYRQPINQGVSVTRSYYESTGKVYLPTSILTKEKNINENESGVSRVISATIEKENILTMSKALISVTLLMIVGSVLLMIVVLYNLGKLNLIESQKDLALLKVLGFKDRKLKSLFKTEMMLYTLIGIIVGVPFGKLLTETMLFSMGSSVDMIYLDSKTTLLFSCIGVLIVVYYISKVLLLFIKKLNMVEVLKKID